MNSTSGNLLDPAMAVVLWILFGLLATVYCIRVVVRGPATHPRINRDGESLLTSKALREMIYWALQPIARFLALLRVPPNRISWASLILGLAAGSAFSSGAFGLGASCAAISGLLDSLDGLVARQTGKASMAGEALDAAIDRCVDFALLGGLAVYYREELPLLAVTLAALLGSFMVSYSGAKAEALGVTYSSAAMQRPDRLAFLIAGATLTSITAQCVRQGPDSLASPSAYPMLVALLLIAAIANRTAVRRFSLVIRSMQDSDLAPAGARQERKHLTLGRAVTCARTDPGRAWSKM